MIIIMGSSGKETEDYRTELNKVFQELKQKNTEKNAISKNLNNLYDKVKEYRSKRLDCFNVLKSSKSEREKLKAEVKSLVSKLKEHQEEKKKFGSADNPRILKAQITKIEWKIQTEVMSYNKEKELTKIRKEIEEKLKSAMQKSSAFKKEFSTRSEIASKVFDEQSKHENVIKCATESQKLRQEIESASQKISEEKNKRKQLNDQINSLKKRIDEIKTVLKEESLKTIDNEVEKSKQGLKDKIREVKEKFSKSKKLTSDDILVLQSNPDEISF